MQMQWLLFLSFVIIYPKRVTTYEEQILTRNPDAMEKQLHEPGFDLTEEEIQKFKIWPNGLIPYFLDDVSFDVTLKLRIRSLLDSFSSVTGLVFSELPGPPDDDKDRWVFFINRRGKLDCEDYNTNNFTNTGVQRVVLGYDCLDAGGGGLAATVLALAGVPPQHNAPNRDEYIDVIMENIIPEKRDLYKVLANDEWLFHDVPYDFLSAGHYSFHKYTVNGSATIVPKDQTNENVAVGEGDGISDKDIWKIRMLYNYLISTRRKSKADCSQMFKPGKDFSDFEPEGQTYVQPRQKPDKYLNSTQKDDQPNQENDKITNEEKKTEEMLQHKNNKLKNKKNRNAAVKKDVLDILPDYDSDLEGPKKRWDRKSIRKNPYRSIIRLKPQRYFTF